MTGIEQSLVTRVGVGGGHGTLDDSKLLLEDGDEGSHAVGGARGVGDDVVVLILVVIRVDSDDESSNAVTLAGSGDEHLLGSGLQMLAGALLVDKHAGGLDDEVDAELAPRKLERVPVGHDLDLLAVDGDGVISDDPDIGVKGAEDGVVLEQVSGGLDAGGIVDGDDLHVGVLAASPAPDEVAADTAKAVDGDLDLHRRGGSRRARGLGGGSVELVSLDHASEGGALSRWLQCTVRVQRAHADKLRHRASRRGRHSAHGRSGK
mmetsp:Transcript_5178/g.15483  ORF Transcript_5178/g.15483 Transcript_5178/m.15483 type:complete len:263 (+) Transcript_5178:548-1336(+)